MYVSIQGSTGDSQKERDMIRFVKEEMGKEMVFRKETNPREDGGNLHCRIWVWKA